MRFISLSWKIFKHSKQKEIPGHAVQLYRAFGRSFVSFGQQILCTTQFTCLYAFWSLPQVLDFFASKFQSCFLKSIIPRRSSWFDIIVSRAIFCALVRDNPGTVRLISFSNSIYSPTDSFFSNCILSIFEGTLIN